MNEKTASEKSEKADKSGNRPVHEVRLGRVKATVWANSSENGLWYSVQVGRLFRDEERQQWRTTDGFHREDLPLLIKVVDRVHTWLYEQGERNERNERNERHERHERPEPRNERAGRFEGPEQGERGERGDRER